MFRQKSADYFQFHVWHIFWWCLFMVHLDQYYKTKLKYILMYSICSYQIFWKITCNLRKIQIFIFILWWFFIWNIFCFISTVGTGKVTITDLEPAVSFCDILIYGWAGIDGTTNKAKSLNELLDLDQGQGAYRQVTSLKNRYPKLKILLGIGGNADPNRDIYVQLLENPASYNIFINSAYTLVKSYGFDGVDIAWQFKPNKPKRIRSSLGK